MAGEKMKKDESGMCEGCCGGGMCGMCGIIGSVLMLLGAGALVLYGLNSEPGATDSIPGDMMILVAGVMLVLLAVGKLVHALKLCPMCNKK